ncbi:MAG: tetratricopeptide repeat protein [Verrucomicrobiae bacterium]|nr:tetratricopeptide repeat protein [Verrucomicrobiae bacterium]
MRTFKTSKGRRKDLQFEVAFLEGLVRRAPDYVEALKLLAKDLTRLGRHEEALKVDERLARLLPNDPIVHYNLACSYSLTHNYLQAFDALEKAIDLGYSNFRWLRRDPDLKNLRTHSKFRLIKEKIRKARSKQVK